jgi:lipopolysaccharide export system permease protein
VSILDRYVAGEVLRHFVYALTALLAIFFVINLTEELRLADTPGYGAGEALRFVLWMVPSEAHALLPAAALLGTVLGLGGLVSNHEVVALQAAGVSRRRLVGAVLVAAVMLGGLGVGLGEFIAAPLSQQARRQRALALSGGRTLSAASGLWLREGSQFINVGLIYPSGALGDVYVFDFNDRRDLRRYVHAAAASRTGEQWQLEDVRERVLTDGGGTTRQAATEPWATTIDVRRVRTLWLQPEDLGIGDLYRTIRSLRDHRQNPVGYEIAFWRRISAPVYMAVMVLLAVPIIVVSGRTVRVGERIAVGALVGLGFQFLQQMFTNVGLASGLPPVVTALTPLTIAAAMAAVLYRRRSVP